jgi:adenosylhomocysteine nucleosidase
MKRIAIIAAMPGEVKSLVRGWQHERRGGVEIWTRQSDGWEWIVAYAGAGQQAATRAVAAAEQLGPLDAMVSIGWVGALAEKFVPGRAYRIAGVIDQQTGERFAAEKASDDVWLVTSPRVADEAAKSRLRATYGASLVDMEAAAVARLAAMRGIPFYAIKGVSDGVHDQLPDFNRFIEPTGEFRLMKLVLFVLPRPWFWPALIRMGENSKKAAQAIAEELNALLAQEG